MPTSLHLGIFYMQQIYNMGPTALLPLRRKACWPLVPKFVVSNPAEAIWFIRAN